MNVIAVTGANSFIGQHLIRFLLNRKDLQLRVLIHKNNEFNLRNMDKMLIIKGDILQEETLHEFVVPGCTVINLVYLNSCNKQENLAAIENLCRVCARSKIKRLIHCSTAVVAGKVPDKIINENTKCNPANNYEMTKLAIEELLINKYRDKFEIIILRPTAVFGPGGKNLLKLANSVIRGNRVVNYFKSCLFNDRKMNLVSIENVIAALDFLASYQKKINNPEIFIISDDENSANTYRSVELSLMRNLGLDDYFLPVIPIPLSILGFLLKISGRSNHNPTSIYSCGKLIDIGFKKEIPFQESLRNFAYWHRLNIAGKYGLSN